MARNLQAAAMTRHDAPPRPATSIPTVTGRHVRCQQDARSIIRSIERLRAATDEELIGEHDQLAQHTAAGTAYYVDELGVAKPNERRPRATNSQNVPIDSRS
jgi:hypothetical protein